MYVCCRLFICSLVDRHLDCFNPLAIANRAADGGMTVRQVERLAQKSAEAKDESEKTSKKSKKDTYYTEMELALKNSLSRKVEVKYGNKKGTLTLEFYDKDDLKSLVELLSPDLN